MADWVRDRAEIWWHRRQYGFALWLERHVCARFGHHQGVWLGEPYCKRCWRGGVPSSDPGRDRG